MRRAENAARHADALGSSHGVPVLAKKIEQIVREIKGIFSPLGPVIKSFWGRKLTIPKQVRAGVVMPRSERQALVAPTPRPACAEQRTDVRKLP